MTARMIYIDENIIEESIATLLGDKEVAIVIRRLIEETKVNRESVLEKLKKIAQ